MNFEVEVEMNEPLNWRAAVVIFIGTVVLMTIMFMLLAHDHHADRKHLDERLDRIEQKINK